MNQEHYNLLQEIKGVKSHCYLARFAENSIDISGGEGHEQKNFYGSIKNFKIKNNTLYLNYYFYTNKIEFEHISQNEKNAISEILKKNINTL